MNGVLIPQRVFVGDTAQFLFPLAEQEWQLLQDHITVDTPISFDHEVQSDTITLKDVRVILREKQPYLQITFVPWETGTVYFPPLSFLNLHNKLPPVHIESILEATGAAVLQNPKLPLLIPGTDYLLYGVAIGTAAVGSILAAVSVTIAKKLRRYFLFGTAKRRVRLLRKNMKKLQKYAKKLQKTMVHTQDLPQEQAAAQHTETIAAIKTWYSQFDYALRLYIASLVESSRQAKNRYTARTGGSPEEKLANCRTDTHAAPTADSCDASRAIRMQILSATYRELLTVLQSLFIDQSGIVQSFSLLYHTLETERFGSSGQELFCQYAGSAALLLGSIPELIKTTELTHARLLYAAQKGAADA